MVLVCKDTLLIQQEIKLIDEVGPVGRPACASEIPNM